MSTKREQGMMGIQNREKRKSLFFSLLVFPSDPASLNDKLRCLQISDREQRGRGIIAGKFKDRRLRRLMICMTVNFSGWDFTKENCLTSNSWTTFRIDVRLVWGRG